MPPKKTTTEEGAPTGLTDGELRFIKAIFDNMTQKPDADWDAVATTLGLKDAKCAKERFRQMSVRHGWRDQSSSGAAASPRKAAAGDKVTKKRATPRKKAAAAKKAEEDEETKEEVKAEDKKDVVKSEDVDDDTE
ncbi:hypothetical protein BHE90_015800 [Fusarium euwallaceae]|uniref:Myb-like domain-containing protein n=4 Tax=Fusarium solani species complex TaxID=232080 RepID=A0A3M2RI09_9HYPO|nr:hypothetical protein CDV36_014407 [Fusarium kuroshium]RSL59455.1 hypothetical protein CEP51_013919 [Fusarium floridanum]RSM09968.1 hypothetical protein CDV31_007486 [Fusarium ambrosium]RTE69810.1 hypothetical protein BHE90_015800 [Fusarium euwallaceae]